MRDGQVFVMSGEDNPHCSNCDAEMFNGEECYYNDADDIICTKCADEEKK